MSISRNAAYTLVGTALPSVLTLVTVPLYLQVVGIERYGVLTLCWVILGYSAFLDLGLGPAVARRISVTRDEGAGAAGEVFWTAIWLSLVTGLAGSVAIYFGATYYFQSMAEVNSAFRSEVAEAIPLIAAIVPILMFGSALGGALHGREKFLALTVVGAVGNSLLALLPLVLAYLWSPTLIALVAGALGARLLPIPLFFWVCAKVVPVSAPRRPSARIVKELLSFGGWVSLTGIAIGLIATVDRLAIGSMIGAAAVSAYAIPYSLVSRITLIPHSLGIALFPRFAYVEQEERNRLIASGIQAIAVIITPMSIALIAITDPFFTLWIGPELTPVSAPIAYVLVGGFWIYCIGYTGFTMLQASGRPKLVSQVLLVELALYFPAILLAMWAFGLIGAAVASTLRIAVESFFMLRLAAVPLSGLKALLLPALLTAASIGVAAGISNPVRYLILAVLLAASIGWSILNIPDVLRPYVAKLTSIVPALRRRAG